MNPKQRKPRYYVLVDEGHSQFSRWDAFTLEEARKTRDVLKHDMFFNKMEIVRRIKQ